MSRENLDLILVPEYKFASVLTYEETRHYPELVNHS